MRIYLRAGRTRAAQSMKRVSESVREMSALSGPMKWAVMVAIMSVSATVGSTVKRLVFPP